MPEFTENQLRELEQVFGLERKEPKLIPIKDGWAGWGDEVWWKANRGPVKVKMAESGNWRNAQNCPDLYSFVEPEVLSVNYKEP